MSGALPENLKEVVGKKRCNEKRGTKKEVEGMEKVKTKRHISQLQFQF